MGFTTKGEETERVTYVERKDITRFVRKFAEEQGWDLSDVRNRALLYYAWKYKEGTLDDPKVDDSAEQALTDTKSGFSIRDLL